MAPRRLPAWLAAFLLTFSLVLGSCAPIQLVPAYDEQIDTGLTELYADTSGFVDKMISLHGTAEGDYAHNKEFYEKASARMDALAVRAEAHRVLHDCPTSKVINTALSAARIPADVRGQIGTLPKDDCQVVLMRLIQTGFAKMEKFHKDQGALGIPPIARGPLLDGGVGALLRAGITVELAKRAK